MYTVEAAIETERLLLRPFEPGDLDDLHAIRSLPEVVRYLYGEVRSLGMRQEAHLRENEIFKGAFGDEFVFAVLEGECYA